jgi:hypothetical protein
MWPAVPRSTAHAEPYLFVYLDKSIEIYDVFSGVWLQSLALSNARPLTSDGFISLCHQQLFVHVTRSTRPTLPLNIAERRVVDDSCRRTQSFDSDVSTTKKRVHTISSPTGFEHRFHLSKSDALRMSAIDIDSRQIFSLPFTSQHSTHDQSDELVDDKHPAQTLQHMSSSESKPAKCVLLPSAASHMISTHAFVCL